MDVPFGNWEPDRQELSPGSMMVADGVQPLPEGYGPFPSLTISGTATALPAQPRGVYAYQTADGTWGVAAGTTSNMYLKATDDSWTSIDSGLTLAASDDFSFERFGTKLLYTNISDGLRAYDVEAGGAIVATSDAKNPRWIFECGNLLFGLDCIDSSGSRNNRLIRSSAISDHTNWLTKGADYQGLESGGALVWGGKLSDTTALVLQQRAVRLIQVGNVGNALWGIQSITEEFGSVGAKSCIRFDGMVFWVATDGFRMFSMGGGIERIGAGAVDQYFLSIVDQTDMTLIQGTIDPFRKNVFWRFKRAANSSVTVFEDIIGYNWQFKKWFTLTVQTAYIGSSAQVAYTWDAYDATATWDSLNAGLVWDSRLLQGGQPLFGAFDSSYKFGYFAGSNMAATLTTATTDSQTSEIIQWAKPVDDASAGLLEIGVKNLLSDSITWKTGVAKSATGWTPQRARGTEIALRRTIDAGSTWNYAKGVEGVGTTRPGPR